MTRVVVVTGAGYGVGRAVAEAFADRRASVALVSRGEASLDAARAGVESRGGRALSLPTDVADAEAVEAAAERTEQELGAIDVWVNCAMATIFAPFVAIDPDEYRRATEVTYLGYVWGTLSALRRMRARDRGTIVQVGSALAYRGIPLQSAYCGAKHAIQGFTSSVRTELINERSNVHVTSVHLPALNTPQFDVGRSKMPRRPRPVAPVYEPDVAADAVVWAAEHRRRELWVGGSTAVAIVGNRLLPWLGDLYLGRTGVAGQQTDEPAAEAREDNLFASPPGVRGARGRFADEALTQSVQLRLAMHRDSLLAAAGIALAAVALRRR